MPGVLSKSSPNLGEENQNSARHQPVEKNGRLSEAKTPFFSR